MKYLNNRKGNAVLVAVAAGGLALAGLTLMLSQVANFSQQVGKSESAATGGDDLNKVIRVLQNKFKFHLDPNPNVDPGDNDGADLYVCHQQNPELCKPDWAPDYSRAIDPNIPPIITSLLPLGTTAYVVKDLVLGFKDSNGGCIRFNQKETITTTKSAHQAEADKVSEARPISEQGRKKGFGRKKLETTDCDVIPLAVDRGGVSSLQKTNSLSLTEQIQSGFLALPDLSALSDEEKKASFGKGFEFPLDKLNSNQIRFLKYLTADPSESASANPKAITRLLAEVNNTLVMVPIDPPPPPSQCTISLKNPSQQPLDLSAGNVSVLFDVKANSMVQAANFHLGPDDGDLVGSFAMEQMDPQSVANFGQNISLKTNGFALSMSNDDVDIASPVNPNEALRRIAVTLVGLSSIPTDNIVDGSPQMRQTITCATVFRIKKPSPPKCELKVTNAKDVNLKGDIAQLRFSCDDPRGGLVTSATIAGNSVTVLKYGLKKRIIHSNLPKQNLCQEEPNLNLCNLGGTACTKLKRSQGYKDVQCYKYTDIYGMVPTTDLSSVSRPVFEGIYARQTNGGNEVITATASGPGGTTTVQTNLGELCPYQDPDYSHQEFAYNDKFQDFPGSDSDRIENAIADLTFTTGSINYLSHNTYWQSTNAIYGGVASVLTTKDGNWVGEASGANWDKPQACDSANVCMKILQMSNNSYNAFQAGGKAYWVEVGPKTSANCSVIHTKMRHGGCFAGTTKLRMANGAEKLVSQIGENEWLYNPHYNAPVRVKSVVRGPEKKPLFEVIYGEQKVVVTEDHPFLTQTGWVQAIDLKAGSILVGAGNSNQVKKVRQLPYKRAQDVWNFELDTEDPMGHMVLANQIPTGDLVTQQLLKKQKIKVP